MKWLLGLLLLVSLVSCEKEAIVSVEPSGPKGPELEMRSWFRTRTGGTVPRDGNGYWRPTLDQRTAYENFAIFVEASTVADPRYRPNGGIPSVSSFWRTDAYWVIGGTVQIGINTYSPWGNWVYSGGRYRPLPSGMIDISLDQFKGTRVPLVSESRVMLDTIRRPIGVDRAPEFTPGPGMLWSKKYVGPVLKEFAGDTVIFYGETHWDLGNLSWENPELGIRRDTVKVIFGKR